MTIREDIEALKRSRILAAAVELFYENGYENTTLGAVAERLGVTKTVIYGHFSSKSELLAEICSRGIETSLHAIDSVMSAEASPTEKLELLGRRFVAAVLESQMHIAIFSREEKNLAPADFERISQMRRAFDKSLTRLLEEGREAGEFHFGDARLTALAIGGMVSWAYVWFHPTGRLTVAEAAGEMARLILQTAGVRRPSS